MVPRVPPRPFPCQGILLRRLRERRGLTVDELGALLEVRGAGVSAAIYRQMEDGRYLLPEDSQRFTHVYAKNLKLTKDELQVLVDLWSLAILTQELDEELGWESVCTLISGQMRAPTAAP